MKIHLTYNGVTHVSKEVTDTPKEEMEEFIGNIVKDKFNHLSFDLEDGGRIYLPAQVLQNSYIILK